MLRIAGTTSISSGFPIRPAKITIIMDAPEGECQASLRAAAGQSVVLCRSRAESSLKLVDSAADATFSIVVQFRWGEGMSRALAILVTGAAGRIGRAAVRELVARGHRVRAFDVVAAGGTDDVIVGNITDPEAVRRAVQGIDVLIHLAATPDDDDFLERLLPNNLVGAYHVLEEARLAGVRKMVLGSSGQVVWWQRFTGPLPVRPMRRRARGAGTRPPSCFRRRRGRAFAAQYGISVIAARLGWCPRDQAHVDELGRTEWGPDVYFSPARCRPLLRVRGRGPGRSSIRSGLRHQPPGAADHLRPDARP